MVVLPKITFFQSVDNCHTSSIKMLDSIIRPFIWVYEPHVQKHTEEAGLGLPDFRHIFRPVMQEHGYSGSVWGVCSKACPRWPDIKSCNTVSLTGASLSAIFFSNPDVHFKPLSNNLFLSNLL